MSIHHLQNHIRLLAQLEAQNIAKCFGSQPVGISSGHSWLGGWSRTLAA